MAEPDFQPFRRSVDELLSGSEYFVIPRFQRPYSWDRGNIEEFWRDVFEDNDIGYFIGPMVGWRRSRTSSDLYVVDGQQRLTTIVLLLALVRDHFARLGETKLASGLHRYIEKPDRDDESHFVLRPELASPFLNNRLLARDADLTVTPRTVEERQYELAHGELSSRVESLVAGLTKAQAVRQLKELRDDVLGLRVIWVEHSNEDDAYVVFETLNGRGKDLEVVDLLKNHLLNLLRRGGNRSADAYRDQWNRVRTVVEDTQARIDVNRFVQHWWLSQEEYVAQRKLFQAIKKKVRTRSDAENRLRALEEDAHWYRLIYDPTARDWGPEEREIPRSLQALADFGIVQPAPLLLSILRARRDRSVNLSQIIVSLQTIERFHFQFTTISQQSSSGGISEMYAKYARELTRATSNPARVERLKALRGALAVRVPDAQIFDAAFVERLVFTDSLTRDKKLVQYVLRRLHEHTHPRTRVEPATIEHLLPQSAIGEVPATVVGNVGNLLFLPQDINERLDSKPFNDKKRILSKHAAQFDLDDVLAADEWGPDEIAARAARLSQLARDQVWALPVSTRRRPV